LLQQTRSELWLEYYEEQIESHLIQEQVGDGEHVTDPIDLETVEYEDVFPDDHESAAAKGDPSGILSKLLKTSPQENLDTLLAEAKRLAKLKEEE